MIGGTVRIRYLFTDLKFGKPRYTNFLLVFLYFDNYSHPISEEDNFKLPKLNTNNSAEQQILDAS